MDQYDFQDTSDLPEDIARQLKRQAWWRLGGQRGGGGPDRENRIIEILKQAGQPMTLAEIRAVAYRQTGHDVSVCAVASPLSRLKKEGRVFQPCRGLWQIADGLAPEIRD